MKKLNKDNLVSRQKYTDVICDLYELDNPKEIYKSLELLHNHNIFMPDYLDGNVRYYDIDNKERMNEFLLLYALRVYGLTYEDLKGFISLNKEEKARYLRNYGKLYESISSYVYGSKDSVNGFKYPDDSIQAIIMKFYYEIGAKAGVCDYYNRFFETNLLTKLMKPSMIYTLLMYDEELSEDLLSKLGDYNGMLADFDYDNIDWNGYALTKNAYEQGKLLTENKSEYGYNYDSNKIYSYILADLFRMNMMLLFERRNYKNEFINMFGNEGTIPNVEEYIFSNNKETQFLIVGYYEEETKTLPIGFMNLDQRLPLRGFKIDILENKNDVKILDAGIELNDKNKFVSFKDSDIVEPLAKSFKKVDLLDNDDIPVDYDALNKVVNQYYQDKGTDFILFLDADENAVLLPTKDLVLFNKNVVKVEVRKLPLLESFINAIGGTVDKDGIASIREENIKVRNDNGIVIGNKFVVTNDMMTVNNGIITFKYDDVINIDIRMNIVLDLSNRDISYYKIQDIVNETMGDVVTTAESVYEFKNNN